ncbi:serine hydrolase-like protein [Lissotriton helveticus]
MSSHVLLHSISLGRRFLWRPLDTEGFEDTTGTTEAELTAPVINAHSSSSYSRLTFKRGAPMKLQIPVPWGRLACLTWGPVEGRPVLCLHGWMDNANTFQKLVPLLPQDRRYIALDFSGHGQSSHLSPGSSYDYKNYVKDLYITLEALNYRQISIIGHSMGGVIGTVFAYLFPDMVDKLGLIDSYGFFPSPLEILLNRERKVIAGGLHLKRKRDPTVYSPEGALKRLLDANNSLTEQSARILLERGTKEVPGGVIFSRDINVTRQLIPNFTLDQCLGLMKEIQASILTILASDGMFASIENRTTRAAQWSDLVQGFQSSLKERYQLELIQGNHFVHLNEPEKVAGLIGRFLQDEDSGSAGQ